VSGAAAHGTLLIGLGNELRGDDAAGPEVVRQVAAALPEGSGWRTLVVHGLTPELVDELVLAVRVIFVDATVELLEAPRRQLLTPSVAAAQTTLGHALPAAALLGLCLRLHGSAPVAELIEIPAHSFELGASLSDATKRAVDSVSQDLIAWRIPRSNHMALG
jgi:hydrogenase maturation protease